MIIVDLKIKEKKGNREYIIDKIKNVKVEAAIVILQDKYLVKETQNKLMKRFDNMYKEIKKEYDQKYG